MSSKTRGVTLIETLFSMFICSLVMLGLANTLSSAGSISRNRQEMDKAIEVFHVFSLLSADASAAIELTSPAPRSAASTLSLRRVNPRLSFEDRVDVSGGGDEMDPYESRECLNVLYQIEDNMLVRASTVPGETTIKERLIGCEELAVSRIGVAGTLLNIELTLSGERVSKKRRIRVCLR